MESINEEERPLREVGLQTKDLLNKFVKVDLPYESGQVEWARALFLEQTVVSTPGLRVTVYSKTVLGP
jgi:hypothetical protein